MYDFICCSGQSSYLYVRSLYVYKIAIVNTHRVLLPVKYTTYLNSTRSFVKLTEQWIKVLVYDITWRGVYDTSCWYETVMRSSSWRIWDDLDRPFNILHSVIMNKPLCISDCLAKCHAEYRDNNVDHFSSATSLNKPAYFRARLIRTLNFAIPYCKRRQTFLRAAN